MLWQRVQLENTISCSHLNVSLGTSFYTRGMGSPVLHKPMGSLKQTVVFMFQLLILLVD